MELTDETRIVDNIVIRNDADRYFSLKALSDYSGLSVRTLRKAFKDPLHPLPHYRLRGKILVRKSEFDRWMQQFHREGPDVDRLVAEILKEA